MKKLLPIIGIFSCLIAAHLFAGSATWSSNPVSDDWYTPENWVPATVPNGPDDIATIGPSTITTIVIPEQSVTELDSLVFTTTANITIADGASLTFEGVGAFAYDTNSTIDLGLGSSLVFTNSSTCAAGLGSNLG